jgi:hypothetical protein
MLYESSFTQTTRISQQAGTIVLKATESGGSLNKLALVRLDTSAADGSAILLQANQITLDGQTTFLNSLAVNRFTQVASNNEVIENNTAPTQRPNATTLQNGDVWINTSNNNRLPNVWNGLIWLPGFTVIDGGTITTGTINANNVAIQNTATNPRLVIDNNGIEFAIGSSYQVGTGLVWNPGGAKIYATFDSLAQISLEADSLRISDGTGFYLFDLGVFTSDKIRIGDNVSKATIQYTTDTARTLTIPNVGGNRTFSFIDQAQTLSENQTFNFGNFLLRNTGNNGSATINYGTASADRTYTLVGASSNILTDARGLQFEQVVGGAVAPDSYITVVLPNGARYSIPAQLEP